MSRKITDDAVNAFLARRPWRRSNTEVQVYGGQVVMFLHDNPIARYRKGWHIDGEITFAGYNTMTTRERLNGLPGVSVCTVDHEPVFNNWLVMDWDAWMPVNGYTDPATLVHETDRKGYALYEQLRCDPDAELSLVKRAMGIVQRLILPNRGITLLVKPWMEEADGEAIGSFHNGSKRMQIDEWRDLPVVMDKILEEA